MLFYIFILCITGRVPNRAKEKKFCILFWFQLHVFSSKDEGFLIINIMCSFRKYPFLPNRRSMEIPRGGGVCTVPENIHTSPTEDQWKFQGGGGGKSKCLKRKVWSKIEIGWGYAYFLEPHGGKFCAFDHCVLTSAI